MKNITLGLAALGLCIFVGLSQAQAEAPVSGVSAVLGQLHELFGDFTVNGRMMDGTRCKVTVASRPTQFSASLADDRAGQLLISFEMRPGQRLAFFDIRQNPEVRAELRIRDRSQYPGAPVRETDTGLFIETWDGGRKLAFEFEDHVRRKRYTCRGEKTAPHFYSPWTPGR